MSDPSERFDGLCASLLKNDPRTKEVTDLVWRLPQGYGPRLGDALVGNTQVSYMELRLCTLVESMSDDTTCPSSLIKFLSTSAVLNKVALFDDDTAVSSTSNTLIRSDILTAMNQNPAIVTLDCMIFYRPRFSCHS
jgi:hypothetical protein